MIKKLSPVKKMLLLWTAATFPLIILTSIFIATGYFNQVVGGLVFIASMVVVIYGNYRITKIKPEVKKNGL